MSRVGLAHRLYTGDISYDFVGRKKTWYIASVVIVVFSVLVLAFKGLSLGIEFRGGADFQTQVTTSQGGKVTTEVSDRIRKAVLDTALPDLESSAVLIVGDSAVRVQTRTLTTDEVVKVRSAIAAAAGVTQSDVAYTLIGASWGEDTTRWGVIALGIFVLGVMALIWVYFRDWKMSLAAVIALLHDLVITVGVYALVGFSVTPATLIGVLTILGYSLYDTVVVFDKVRENVVDLEVRGRTYSQAANLAVNQVLIRSLNTTVIGVLPVGALLIAGTVFLSGGPLVDLGVALFVGMIAGAYSSIFIATPLLADLREREPAMVTHRERLAKRARKASEAAKTIAVDVVVSSQPAESGERVQQRRLPRSKRMGR